MAETGSNLQIGAYFYPITQSCPEREARATQFGVDPGEDLHRVPNELDLARYAKPLFEGHDQPRTYCLPDSREGLKLRWDDADPETFLTQVMLARDHGLSYFIINGYRGLQDGQAAHELAEVTRVANRTLRMLGDIGFKYARMETLERTRAVLPIPPQDWEEFFFAEPDRTYDTSLQAARHLVDSNVQEWANPNYLYVGGIRPYVPILMPNIPVEYRQDVMKRFIHEMLEYSFHKYEVIPYLVGVMRHSSDLESWMATEVDAITNYLDLYDASSPSTTAPEAYIQRYDDLMDKREAEWKETIQAGSKVVIPSVPVGWDASPRGEQGHRLESVAGWHPYTPLVVGSTACRFAQGLQTVVDLTRARIPEGEQYVTVWAWNEVSEGGTIVPRLRGRTVDVSYLEAVRDTVRTLGP